MEKVMEVPKIFESEYKLCLILLDNEPISISNLLLFYLSPKNILL